MVKLILIMHDGFCHEVNTYMQGHELFQFIQNMEHHELVREVR